MTDTNALSPCPHLESCPWCGCALYAVWRRANPRASCKTEGCFGRKMAVVNLDDPSDVAAWNRRAPAPAPTDAEIDAIADQHEASGHGTVWPHAFARAVLAKWGARVSQLKAAPASQLAAAPRNAPLYDPDDVAFPIRHSADRADAPPPELASIATSEVVAPSVVPECEPLTEEQMHKELAALCERIFNTRVGKACRSCEGGTYRADHNGYSQFHRCSKCHYVPMWGEDGSEFGITATKKGDQGAER